MKFPFILSKYKGKKIRRPEWRKGSFLQIDEELGCIVINYGIKDKQPRIIMLLSDYNALDWELYDESDEENNGH